MIPDKIHQIWVGDKPMPDKHVEWHNMWKELHPGWEVKLWGAADIEAIGLDMNFISSHYWSSASISNLVRLSLVLRFGGFYLDTDMEPRKSIHWLRQPYGNAVVAPQLDGRLCNAFFGAPEGHDWVKWQLGEALKLSKEARHDAAWGVYLMTDAPRDNVHVLPTDRIYPFDFNTPIDQRVNPSEDAYMIHHWDGSWVQK